MATRFASKQSGVTNLMLGLVYMSLVCRKVVWNVVYRNVVYRNAVYRNAVYRKVSQWSAVMLLDLEDCCQRLHAQGASGLWTVAKGCIHKIKGTLMLYGQEGLLAEAAFLSTRNMSPVGWEEGGFEEFVGTIERFVQEFGNERRGELP